MLFKLHVLYSTKWRISLLIVEEDLTLSLKISLAAYWLFWLWIILIIITLQRRSWMLDSWSLRFITSKGNIWITRLWKNPSKFFENLIIINSNYFQFTIMAVLKFSWLLPVLVKIILTYLKSICQTKISRKNSFQQQKTVLPKNKL